MIEKIPLVKNPLTIVAIFAGLAEIGGTIVLPLLDSDIQSIFVWYVMGFPTLLVILFFLTLNFNHRVLYAPSDYTDEANFMKGVKQAGSPIDVSSEIVNPSNEDDAPTL